MENGKWERIRVENILWSRYDTGLENICGWVIIIICRRMFELINNEHLPIAFRFSLSKKTISNFQFNERHGNPKIQSKLDGCDVIPMDLWTYVNYKQTIIK